MGETKGKVKEAVGWATGDREVEAEGRVEQKAADGSEPIDDVTEDVVEEEKDRVRVEHRDVEPDQ